MGFQKQVNLYPAPAVEGDFASANPRTVVLADEGALVSGANGVTVGKFGWIGTDGRTVDSFGQAPNAPDGFVHRDQQALITNYLGEESMVIPPGFEVTLFNNGDFWAMNAGGLASVRNGAIYARYSDGAIFCGAAPGNGSGTGSMGSTNTASIGATFTASAGSPNTKLVVTAVTGYIAIGDVVSGTGITPGTTIVSQDTGGTPNGAGTYNLSAANTCSAATVTSFGTTMKVTSTTGLISVGETVSGGTGFPTSAAIVSQATGGTPGGAGIYTLSNPATAYVASAAGVTTFGEVLDITAVASGSFSPGDPITGTGLPSNAVIASQVSGTLGGVGVYTLSAPATAYAASTADLAATGGVLCSAWHAENVAQVGELVKISTW